MEEKELSFSRIAMMHYLTANPDTEFEQYKDLGGKDIELREIGFNVIDGLAYKDTGEAVLFFAHDKSQFRIKQQKKLRKMLLGEALYELLRKGDPYAFHKLKSVVTGLTYNRTNKNITKEEFMGEWTVDDVFEK